MAIKTIPNTIKMGHIFIWVTAAILETDEIHQVDCPNTELKDEINSNSTITPKDISLKLVMESMVSLQ